MHGCMLTCAHPRLQGYLLGGQRTGTATSILQLSSGYTLDFVDYTLLAQVGSDRQQQDRKSGTSKLLLHKQFVLTNTCNTSNLFRIRKDARTCASSALPAFDLHTNLGFALGTGRWSVGPWVGRHAMPLSLFLPVPACC